MTSRAFGYFDQSISGQYRPLVAIPGERRPLFGHSAVDQDPVSVLGALAKHVNSKSFQLLFCVHLLFS
jgi:hypothetical protein